MGKEALRKGMLAALVELDRMKRREVEKQLHDQLYALDFWKKADMIGVTLSQEFEWDTRELVQKAWHDGKRVCVPKSFHETKELHFYEITDFDQVEAGYMDIEEPIPGKCERVQPESIHLLLVPGVVFNRAGYRIGFGGGYYDRFLQNYKGLTLSLVHSNQLIENLPVESHDLPVDYIVTEEELIECKKER
jgi:5-formyltetrahydrofolate cyclo-ligase